MTREIGAIHEPNSPTPGRATRIGCYVHAVAEMGTF